LKEKAGHGPAKTAICYLAALRCVKQTKNRRDVGEGKIRPVRQSDSFRGNGTEEGSVFLRKRAYEVDDLAADLGIADPHEGAVELQTFGAGQEIDDIGRLALFGQTLAGARSVLEEECYRNFEDRGDRLKPARPDTVGALFVFLDLLEGD